MQTSRMTKGWTRTSSPSVRIATPARTRSPVLTKSDVTEHGAGEQGVGVLEDVDRRLTAGTGGVGEDGLQFLVGWP